MRRWGFRAREAMGWLRIMRPGSVIGEQQAYLCEVEARWCSGALPGPDCLQSSDSDRNGHGGEEASAVAEELAAQVAAGMARRCGSAGRKD
jgi:hypothetical protein